jgi:hypothetical protein
MILEYLILLSLLSTRPFFFHYSIIRKVLLEYFYFWKDSIYVPVLYYCTGIAYSYIRQNIKVTTGTPHFLKKNYSVL